MSTAEILEELRRLTPAERLRVVEAALREIEKEIACVLPGRTSDLSQRLAHAAQALRPDYVSDKELTAFTALDVKQ